MFSFQTLTGFNILTGLVIFMKMLISLLTTDFVCKMSFSTHGYLAYDDLPLLLVLYINHYNYKQICLTI